MIEILKVMLVIIGTIIGAGFASGKEIYLFFARYGVNGIIGLIISAISIGIIIYKVLKISIKNNISTYEQLIGRIYKNNQIKEILKIIINIFLIISFYVMIAGFSAYFSQELGINNMIATCVICILCYITFLGNIKTIIKVNSLLMPVIILFIIYLIINNIDGFNNIEFSDKGLIQAIIKSILFTSYNSIILIPILLSLKNYIKNIKQAKLVSILTSIIIFIVSISIYGLLLKIDMNISKIELPIVYIAGKMGVMHKYLYGLIILGAIYTSAISAGYGILENYVQNKKAYKKIAILMCSSALIVSRIGFSQLVDFLYPILGILGFLQIFKIILK